MFDKTRVLFGYMLLCVYSSECQWVFGSVCARNYIKKFTHKLHYFRAVRYIGALLFLYLYPAQATKNIKYVCIFFTYFK